MTEQFKTGIYNHVYDPNLETVLRTVIIDHTLKAKPIVGFGGDVYTSIQEYVPSEGDILIRSTDGSIDWDIEYDTEYYGEVGPTTQSLADSQHVDYIQYFLEMKGSDQENSFTFSGLNNSQDNEDIQKLYQERLALATYFGGLETKIRDSLVNWLGHQTGEMIPWEDAESLTLDEFKERIKDEEQSIHFSTSLEFYIKNNVDTHYVDEKVTTVNFVLWQWLGDEITARVEGDFLPIAEYIKSNHAYVASRNSIAPLVDDSIIKMCRVQSDEASYTITPYIITKTSNIQGEDDEQDQNSEHTTQTQSPGGSSLGSD